MKNNMFVVKDYDFKIFNDSVEDEEYSDKSFDHIDKINEETINIEKRFSEKNNFEIHPITKDKRGINEQESLERDKIIKNEIEIQLENIRDEAFQEGYQEGKEKGKMDVYEQTKLEAREKLERLSDMISDVLETKITLIKKEKEQMYNLICTMVKWIILRELNNDGDYVKRLLDALSQEIESSSDILVCLDRESFESMPDFVDYAKEKLERFENVKVEVDHELKGKGIVIHSESEILSGTLEEQMNSLEKILESYNIENEESNDIS